MRLPTPPMPESGPYPSAVRLLREAYKEVGDVAAERDRLREQVEAVREQVRLLEALPAPSLCLSSDSMHDCWSCGAATAIRAVRSAL